MKQKNISIYIDLLFCAVILPIVLMLTPVEKWIVHHTTFMLTLITYLYTLYFIYRKINLPSTILQGKYLKAAAIILIIIIITELVSSFPLPENSNSQNIDTPQTVIEARRHLRTQIVWYFFFIVTGFSLAIELVFELFKQIISKQEIEAEKNKAELALYKSQINPHFLFNTLNAIYGLVVSQSEKTESAFIKFSNIMQYMYSQSTSDTIDIESEINYIQQYVDLQRLRLNHHTQIELTAKTDNSGIKIPSMILITFIENSFKYGTSPDIDCKIKISITVENYLLMFSTENKIIRTGNKDIPAIGIKNCRKRLELLYPDKFILKNFEQDGKYFVSLKVKLK